MGGINVQYLVSEKKYDQKVPKILEGKVDESEYIQLLNQISNYYVNQKYRIKVYSYIFIAVIFIVSIILLGLCILPLTILFTKDIIPIGIYLGCLIPFIVFIILGNIINTLIFIFWMFFKNHFINRFAMNIINNENIKYKQKGITLSLNGFFF
jgi:hypothetical protein